MILTKQTIITQWQRKSCLKRYQCPENECWKKKRKQTTQTGSTKFGEGRDLLQHVQQNTTDNTGGNYNKSYQIIFASSTKQQKLKGKKYEQ